MNLLNVSLQHSIVALASGGMSRCQIARQLKLDRETDARYLRLAEVDSKPAIVPTGRRGCRIRNPLELRRNRPGPIRVGPVSGTVQDGDDLSLTFGNVALDFETYTANSQVLFRGLVRILEINQLSGIPLREVSFTGVLTVTAWPEQTGEFGKYTVRATSTSVPTIKRRYQA